MSLTRQEQTSPRLRDAPVQMSTAGGAVPVATGLSGAVKSTLAESVKVGDLNACGVVADQFQSAVRFAYFQAGVGVGGR